MGNHFTSQVKLASTVYYPGNHVLGTATIKVDEPSKCIAGRIEVRGTERSSAIRGIGQDAAAVSNTTTFYSETLTLFGHALHDDDHTEVTIQPGTYKFPFAFHLPMNLPGTLDMADWSSGGARVHYEVRAYIQLCKDNTAESIAPFKLLVPINRRDLDEGAPAPTLHRDVHLHHFFVDKGHAKVEVKLDRGIYAADDVITGRVTIDNTDGHMEIEKLVATIQCHVKTAVKSGPDGPLCGGAMAEQLVHETDHFHVKPGETKTVPLKLRLPHVIQYPSYPARGLHFGLHHDLSIHIGDDTLVLPLHIATCADPRNRFAFVPFHEPAMNPPSVHEYLYEFPQSASSISSSFPRPTGLQAQPKPTATTPQALGMEPKFE